jgi:hypothetical protein
VLQSLSVVTIFDVVLLLVTVRLAVPSADDAR